MGVPHREPRRQFSYKEGLKQLRQLLNPLVRFLSVMRVRPDVLTATGWALSTGAGVLFGAGFIRTAGVVMLLGGLFDALDGAVARESDQTSSFGAFFDSTLDRLSESAIFIGIMFFYITTSHPYGALLAGIAMTFSFMTSYTRARAEAMGYECQVGVFERAERVLILALLAISGLMTVAVGVIAAGAAVTTMQRILHVRAQSRH